MMVPTRILGSSEAYGSWNISCRSRRRLRSSVAPRADISSPSKRMDPDVGRSRETSNRPTVVLPQPDSPTRPKVSPLRMSKVTPETALTLPTWRRKTAPDSTGNSLTRSRTSRMCPAWTRASRRRDWVGDSTTGGRGVAVGSAGVGASPTPSAGSPGPVRAAGSTGWKQA